MKIVKMSVDEIKRRMDEGEPIIFIDTRNQRTWNESKVKLPGALHIQHGELEKHLGSLPRDRLIITYAT